MNRETVPDGDEHIMWDTWLSRTWFPTVMVADELQIFALLARNPCTWEELAKTLRLNSNAARSVLALLASLGLLHAHDGIYELTGVARTYLSSESPFYWGGVFAQTRGFDAVAARIRRVLSSPSEEGVPTNKAGASWGEKWTARTMTAEAAADVARFMHSHSAGAAARIARTGLFAGVNAMLDVGGGSGCYSIAIAREHPGLRSTLLELPQACGAARGFVRDAGMADRIEVRGLDMFQDEWPTGHDAVFLSNILHDWPQSRCAELLDRAHRALPANGRICVHEALLDEDGNGPRTVAALSVLVMLGTPGRQLTRSELRQLLGAAGFVDMEVTSIPPTFSLVRARKT